MITARPEGPQPAAPSGRGVRTALLSAALVLALAAASLAILLLSLDSQERAVAPESAPGIRGTVSVAPALRDRVPAGAVLFVVARKSAGHPFAVLRIPDPRFPLPYRLGPETVMGEEAFEGEVTLSAKLVPAGAPPADPGVLEGERPGWVPVGSAGADIVLSRAP